MIRIMQEKESARYTAPSLVALWLLGFLVRVCVPFVVTFTLAVRLTLALELSLSFCNSINLILVNF